MDKNSEFINSLCRDKNAKNINCRILGHSSLLLLVSSKICEAISGQGSSVNVFKVFHRFWKKCP